MNHVVLDFETHYTSQYGLSRMTTAQYIMDPRFQVIGVGVQWPDDNRPSWFTDGEAERQLSRLASVQEQVEVTSHNAIFDLSILSFRYGIMPAAVSCTMSMAACLGLRIGVGGSLAALADTMRAAGYNIPPKGNEVVAALGKRREDFTDAELAAYGRYCVDDTIISAAVYKALRPEIPGDEMFWQHQIITAHTMPLLKLDAQVCADELARIQERRRVAGITLAQRLGLGSDWAEKLKAITRSRPKVATMLETLGATVPMKVSEATGVPVPALSKKDPEFLALLDHPDESVRALVEARLEFASSIEESRTSKFLELSKLPFFPAPYIISGAHTGRLGGSDGINVANLPSGRKAGQTNALKRAIIPRQKGNVLIGVDSAQIEVRVLDYLAGDTRGLDEFKHGVCPYSSMALNVWPTEGVTAAMVKALAKAYDELWAPRRQIGKTIVLGAGFGSGGLGFKVFAETTAGVKMTLEEATEYITKYRASKPKIPAFWRKCGRVLQALVDGQRGEFGGLDDRLFYFDGARRVLGVSMPGIRLPNGLWLSYPGLSMHREERVNDAGEVEMRKVFTFKTKKGRAVETVYTHGAVIAENCIAGDAEVLTEHGWRRLDTITTERVHDGVAFVEHGGLVRNGKQYTVTIDGVNMTPDHEVLTYDGWKQAREVLLPARSPVRSPAGAAAGDTEDVEFRLRLRPGCGAAVEGGVEGVCPGAEPELRVQDQDVPAEAEDAWHDTPPSLRGVALDARQVPAAVTPGVAQLWRPWDHRGAGVGDELRAVLDGHGADVCIGPGYRPHGQQRGVQQGELPVGDPRAEQQQQADHAGGGHTRGSDDRGAGGAAVRRGGHDHPVPTGRGGARPGGGGADAAHGVAAVSSDMPSPHEGRPNAASAGRDAGIPAPAGCGGAAEHGAQQGTAGALVVGGVERAVFDLRNCGPRHRFVVRGQHGPFVVHNCTQAVAFAIMKWQARAPVIVENGLVLNTHDEHVISVPAEHAEQARDAMVAAMRTPPPWMPELPLGTDDGIGASYGEC